MKSFTSSKHLLAENDSRKDSCGQDELVLAVNLVRYGQLLATLGATSCQYATTVSRLHTLTETMLVVSLSVVRLECSFHFRYAVFIFLICISDEAREVSIFAKPHGFVFRKDTSTFRDAKLRILFRLHKLFDCFLPFSSDFGKLKSQLASAILHTKFEKLFFRS